MCRFLLRIGVTANAVTVVGALGASLSAIICFPTGRLFLGTILITFFVLFDLLDGTLARIANAGGSRFGALLDSTLDRMSDAVILGMLLLYLVAKDERLWILVLVNLVAGGLISYIKARSESVEIPCDGGLAERTERLIIVLLSTGVAGLGVPHVLAIGHLVLAALSLITVLQRIHIVYRFDTIQPDSIKPDLTNLPKE